MTGTGRLRSHLISRAQLDLLYRGTPDRGTIETLWQSERSRRLLVMNAVNDAVVAQPQALGSLAPVDEAMAVLEAAEAADPRAFRQVLMHPSVGSWAAYALRRLLGLTSSGTPLWIDVGPIHAVALVAAYRAGLEHQVALPMRHGRVMLPGLGMASFPDSAPWAVAQGASTAGGVSIRHGERVVGTDPADDAWWPLRRVRCGEDPVLAVVLDDIDPFRELADPISPERLTQKDFAAWSRLLEGAWQVLCAHHEATAKAMSAGLVSVNPLPPDGAADGRSASTGEAFGALLTTRPAEPVGLAVALVHEFAHIQLGGLMHLIDMTTDSDRATFYAPWRDDPRPLPGLVQGIYAFTAIAGFWHDQMAAESGPAETVAGFEYSFARGQVLQAVEAVSGSGLLTTAGGELIDGLRRRIASWAPRADAAAELALDAHRTGWRLRHLRPDPSAVQRLARSWISGVDVTVTVRADVVSGDASWWSRSRLSLIRRWVAAETQDDRRPRAEDGADIALIKGDLEAARTAFLARVSAEAGDLGAWSGLALSATGVARTTLMEHPSLVRAVHLQLDGAPEPLALAQWIGRAISGGTASSSR